MNIGELINKLSELPQDTEFFKIEANAEVNSTKIIGRTENLRDNELSVFIGENVLYLI